MAGSDTMKHKMKTIAITIDEDTIISRGLVAQNDDISLTFRI